VIRLVVGSGEAPGDVKLLVSDESGAVVDVVKAGVVSSITLQIEPDAPPLLLVKVQYAEVDAKLSADTCQLPKWTGEGLLPQP